MLSVCPGQDPFRYEALGVLHESLERWALGRGAQHRVELVRKLGEPVCEALLSALERLWEACGERGIVEGELVCYFLLTGFERLVDALQVGDVVEVADLHAVEERLCLAGGKLGVRERADLGTRPHGRLAYDGHHDGRAVHIDAVDLHMVGSPVSTIAKEPVCEAPEEPSGLRHGRHWG